MSRPMTKQEWLSYIEQTWNAAQEEAWSEQPRREWVGLTEEDIEDAVLDDPIYGSALIAMLHEDVTVIQFRQTINNIARAIEAKLKEKNT